MRNLLAIETAILNNPIVKQGLQLSEVTKLQKAVVVSQKKKFADTLKLASVVSQGFEWFKSDDAKAIFNEEGVTWTTDEFSVKVFGYQKSFFHKLVRASKVEQEIVERFVTKCDELEAQGESVKRGVDALLKFANAVEENTTEGGEEGEGDADVETREETLLTFAFKGKLVGQENNVSVRLNLNGDCKSTNTQAEIELAIAMLQNAILNKFN